MPFLSLPDEMILQIMDSLDDSDPRGPIEYDKHRETIRAVMAMRLTCKPFARIAFPHLFRTYCLLPTLKSWLKLCGIVALDHLRRHLETLAFERHNEGTQNYREMMKSISNDIKYFEIDLSLLSKLKVLKAEDKWLITKKANSKIQIPLGECKIQAFSFTKHQPAVWSVLNDLTEISSYDFEFASLNCPMGINGPWLTLLEMDFNGLKDLRLASDGFYSNRYRSNIWPDIELLAKFEHLPNLEEFHLNQYFFGREEATASTVNFTTNVLRFLQKKDWPRLRHLDLRYLTTTVAEFETFVAPHAGTLVRFQMHSGLVCPGVTEEEIEQRYFLPHWIRTVICPRGGGASFEHYEGQPEGFHETPEDYNQPVKAQAEDVDGEDIVMGDDEDNAEFVPFERDAQGDIIMTDV